MERLTHWKLSRASTGRTLEKKCFSVGILPSRGVGTR